MSYQVQLFQQGVVSLKQQKELLLQMEHEKFKQQRELELEIMKHKTKQAQLEIEQCKLDLVKEGKIGKTD